MGGSSLSSPSSTFFLPGPGKLRVLSHPISTVSGWFPHLSRQIKHTGSTFKGKYIYSHREGYVYGDSKIHLAWMDHEKESENTLKNAWEVQGLQVVIGHMKKLVSEVFSGHP